MSMKMIMKDLPRHQRRVTDWTGFLDAYQEVSGRVVGSTREIEPRRQPWPPGPTGLLMRAIRESERDLMFTDVDMIPPLGDEGPEGVVLYRDVMPQAIVELKTTWESRPRAQRSVLMNLAILAGVPCYVVTWDGEDPEASSFEWHRIG